MKLAGILSCTYLCFDIFLYVCTQFIVIIDVTYIFDFILLCRYESLYFLWVFLLYYFLFLFECYYFCSFNFMKCLSLKSGVHSILSHLWAKISSHWNLWFILRYVLMWYLYLEPFKFVVCRNVCAQEFFITISEFQDLCIPYSFEIWLLNSEDSEDKNLP